MSYPNAAERLRLERFPDRIAVEDLRACFALSDADRLLVFAQRGAGSRLGLAVCLAAVRFLGFVPENLASIPQPALEFLAGQTDAAPHELLAYGARAQTRTDHLQLALEHLGWRKASEKDRRALASWLAERAVEHERAAALLELACEHLRARRLLRPPLAALLRMIRTASGESHHRVAALLAGQLPHGRCVELDELLAAGVGQLSELADLRLRAPRTGVRELKTQVARMTGWSSWARWRST